MSLEPALWPTPLDHLAHALPEDPVLYMSPSVLQASARRFLNGFPGLVTYAVKANPGREVLENLVAAGIGTFDVASPDEMRAVREVLPSADLHYHNPVRSMAEIRVAIAYGVRSYSVDCDEELDKLVAAGIGGGSEIAVRLRLPVAGAAYDFGEKFGADPVLAAHLLQRVVAAGAVPSMTFHPGTQCEDPGAWAVYIEACAKVAAEAGVRLQRLNVGGGFPSHRNAEAPELARFFDGIKAAADGVFGDDVPELVCEPGRAMVAEAFSLATRVKSTRRDAVFLNDGIYGGLAEMPVMGNTDRIKVYRDGVQVGAPRRSRVVFGPTCDSLDRLPGTVPLPEDIRDGDFVLFHGLGAYSTALVTRFNGYGAIEVVTTGRLS